MTSWKIDGMSTATPLGILMQNKASPLNIQDILSGNLGGSMGEVSLLAILLGAAYLLHKKIITIHIPATYIGTVFVASFILGRNGFEEMFLGGLLLGAFFMAVDYPTSPSTKKGQFLFAFGCGLLTVLFRIYSNQPEGVSYAIVIMNLLVPIINWGISKKKKASIQFVLMPIASIVFICATTLFRTETTSALQRVFLQRQDSYTKIKEMFPLATHTEDLSFSFSENTSLHKIEEVFSQEDSIGYIFHSAPEGFSGPITIRVGVSKEGAVEKIQILSHTETPGLGSNVEKDYFLNQFHKLSLENPLKIAEHSPKQSMEIEGITGATITTDGFITAINEIRLFFQEKLNK